MRQMSKFYRKFGLKFPTVRVTEYERKTNRELRQFLYEGES